MLNSLQQEYLDNLTDRKIVETEFAANIDAISEIFYQGESDTVMQVYDRLQRAVEQGLPLAAEALKAMQRCSLPSMSPINPMEGLHTKKDMTECMEMRIV